MKNVARWTARKSTKQQGFTLIELMVVVVIVGALILIVMRSVGGNADNATAKALQASATELGKGAGYLHVSLGNGISDLTAANPLTATGKSVLDVLMEGRDAVSNTYQTRFDQLSMRSLDANFTKTTSPAGWRLQNFPVQLLGSNTSGCLTGQAGPGKVCVVYQNVPTEVVRVLADSFGTPYASTAVTTGPIRWTAAANNQQSVAFVVTP